MPLRVPSRRNPQPYGQVAEGVADLVVVAANYLERNNQAETRVLNKNVDEFFAGEEYSEFNRGLIDGGNAILGDFTKGAYTTNEDGEQEIFPGFLEEFVEYFGDEPDKFFVDSFRDPVFKFVNEKYDELRKNILASDRSSKEKALLIKRLEQDRNEFLNNNVYLRSFNWNYNRVNRLHQDAIKAQGEKNADIAIKAEQTRVEGLNDQAAEIWSSYYDSIELAFKGLQNEAIVMLDPDNIPEDITSPLAYDLHLIEKQYQIVREADQSIRDKIDKLRDEGNTDPEVIKQLYERLNEQRQSWTNYVSDLRKKTLTTYNWQLQKVEKIERTIEGSREETYVRYIFPDLGLGEIDRKMDFHKNMIENEQHLTNQQKAGLLGLVNYRRITEKRRFYAELVTLGGGFNLDALDKLEEYIDETEEEVLEYEQSQRSQGERTQGVSQGGSRRLRRQDEGIQGLSPFIGGHVSNLNETYGFGIRRAPTEDNARFWLNTYNRKMKQLIDRAREQGNLQELAILNQQKADMLTIFNNRKGKMDADPTLEFLNTYVTKDGTELSDIYYNLPVGAPVETARTVEERNLIINTLAANGLSFFTKEDSRINPFSIGYWERKWKNALAREDGPGYDLTSKKIRDLFEEVEDFFGTEHQTEAFRQLAEAGIFRIKLNDNISLNLQPFIESEYNILAELTKSERDLLNKVRLRQEEKESGDGTKKSTESTEGMYSAANGKASAMLKNFPQFLAMDEQPFGQSLLTLVTGLFMGAGSLSDKEGESFTFNDAYTANIQNFVNKVLGKMSWIGENKEDPNVVISRGAISDHVDGEIPPFYEDKEYLINSFGVKYLLSKLDISYIDGDTSVPLTTRVGEDGEVLGIDIKIEDLAEEDRVRISDYIGDINYTLNSTRDGFFLLYGNHPIMKDVDNVESVRGFNALAQKIFDYSGPDTQKEKFLTFDMHAKKIDDQINFFEFMITEKEGILSDEHIKKLRDLNKAKQMTLKRGIHPSTEDEEGDVLSLENILERDRVPVMFTFEEIGKGFAESHKVLRKNLKDIPSFSTPGAF